MVVIRMSLVFVVMLAMGQSVCSQGPALNQSEEWTPSPGFPSVAVVKLDSEDTLKILLPALICEKQVKTRQVTITVPYSILENEVTVQKTRQEVHEQEYVELVCSENFKMVRTQLKRQAIQLQDQTGNRIPFEQLAESIRRPAYVILTSGPLSAYRRHYFLEDAMVLMIQTVDPNYGQLPAVEGLDKKWIRTEPMPTVAVAQLADDRSKLQVKYMESKLKTEVKKRTVLAEDGSESEVDYTVQVPFLNQLTVLADLNECKFSTVAGKQLSEEEVASRLATPCRVFWESRIAEYLGSVLKPDTIVVQRKK